MLKYNLFSTRGLYAMLAVFAGWISWTEDLYTQEHIPLRLELAAVFNEQPSELSRLQKPESFSVSLTGDLYIADTGNHRIVKLDPRGVYVNHVGGFGWQARQFDMPVDIACPDALNIYVADYNNQRIERYDKYLEYLSSLGRSKVTELSSDQTRRTFEIGSPAGVAVSSQGDLFCSDGERLLMRKFNRFGSLETEFGGFSEGRGRLERPTRLCVTRQWVYVADGGRIVQFDYYGNFVSEIGAGVLKNVCDVAVDDHGRIFAVDSGRRDLLAFEPGGRLILSSVPYDWVEPRAVDVHRGRVYVLDAARGTIVLFNLVESPE